MSTSGRDMIAGVRGFLHDTGKGYATAARKYQTAEILRRLNEAKERLSKSLLTRPNPARLTAGRLIQTAAITDGANAPVNFYTAFGATKADNTFVATGPLAIVEPLAAVGHDYCYVKAGVFHGANATLIGYHQSASEAIIDSSVPLTEFCDAFYRAVQTLAARELLVQEKSDALDRFTFFTKLLARRMAPLQ